jgi:Uma2 family endonuclease
MEDVMALDRVVVQPAPLPPLQLFEESPWPEQGQWTYEDYLRLPDDGNRYEIIEGVLYMVNAPGYDHQYAVSELHLQMGGFVKANGLGVVLTAPFEIHLSETTRPVQPDVLFIATERKPEPGARFFEGAPDLVVEILSPNSIRLDRLVKFDAYERAGAREYWIVDPGTHSIEVYTLGENGVYALFGQFCVDEAARSAILEGFGTAVGALFSQ